MIVLDFLDNLHQWARKRVPRVLSVLEMLIVVHIFLVFVVLSLLSGIALLPLYIGMSAIEWLEPTTTRTIKRRRQ
jgi:hypothetical protein